MHKDVAIQNIPIVNRNNRPRNAMAMLPDSDVFISFFSKRYFLLDCTILFQQFYDFQIAVVLILLNSLLECGLAILISSIDFSFRFYQRLYVFKILTPGRIHKRSGAVIISIIDFRTCLNQGLENFRIIIRVTQQSSISAFVPGLEVGL